MGNGKDSSVFSSSQDPYGAIELVKTIVFTLLSWLLFAWVGLQGLFGFTGHFFMANKLFEKKTFTSFDKNYSAEIFIKKPDKYRDIENHSIAAENIITMGSALSYTAASFKKDNLSICFEKFSRVINFDKENKSITIFSHMTRYSKADKYSFSRSVVNQFTGLVE